MSAEPLYEQVVAHRARDRRPGEHRASALLNLAMVYVGRGAGRARARDAASRSTAIADEIGSKPVGQSVLEVCAGLAAFERDWARSRTVLRDRRSPE